MGQPVTVIEKPTSEPGVVRFETNRVLTGMGHELYTSADDAVADRPPDRLARRLFEQHNVASVHVNANVVTVTLAPGADSRGIKETIEDLYTFYREGVVPEVPAGAGTD